MLPSSLYNDLFHYADIIVLPKELATLINAGNIVMEKQQKQDFYQAIIKNVERLGGLKEVLKFASYLDNDLLMRVLFTTSSEEVWEVAVSCSPQSLERIFSFCSAQEQESVLQIKNKDGQTLLELGLISPKLGFL
jgi:hypothetical protein